MLAIFILLKWINLLNIYMVLVEMVYSLDMIKAENVMRTFKDVKQRFGVLFLMKI